MAELPYTTARWSFFLICLHIGIFLPFLCSAQNTASLLLSQDRGMRFEALTIEHGLSQNSINCILQDRQGFMWLGTQDGLNRYDGYNFKIYRYSSFDSTTLANNWVETICEDKQGNLWVGTRAGLNLFLKKKNKFIRYSFSKPGEIPHLKVASLVRDQKDRIWVGSQEGLSYIEFDAAQNPVFKHFPYEAVKNRHIINLYVDRAGFLWIATRGAGVFRVNTSAPDAPFQQYKAENGLSSNDATCVTQDKAGHLWVGTENGLNEFDGVHFTQYLPDLSNPAALSDKHVTSIFTDSKKQLWIGTFAQGLGRFDPAEKKFSFYKNNPDDPYSLSDHGNLKAIYEDRIGILWIGTLLGGVNKYDHKKQKFRHYHTKKNDPNSLNNNLVRSLFQDKSGILWVGTQDGGLNRADLRTGQFRHYTHNPLDSNSVSSNTIRAIFEDVDGSLWVTTRKDGVCRMRWKEGKLSVKRFVHRENDSLSISSNSIGNLFNDAQGNLWLCSFEGDLMKYDRTKENFRLVHKGTIKNNPSTWGAFSEGDFIWLGNTNSILLFDLKNEKLVKNYYNSNFPPETLVKSVYKTAAGVVWLGTNKGLVRFEPESGKFKLYTVQDGLPSDMVYGAIEDEKGNIWMSTNKGIARFDPRKETFRNYDVSDGVQSTEFNTGAFFKGSRGEFFFGGINGFNAFFPEEIKDEMTAPQIAFIDFEIFNRSVPIRDADNEHSPLENDITETSELTLSHENYVFTLEFSALHFTDPKRNQYAYILEGFEKEWNYTNWERRFATYTSLPPGEYTFKVKASNHDGIWAAERSLKLTVLPPFWQTWWFRSAVILAMAGMAYSFYRFRINRIKAQNERLERLVAQRTNEITEKNAELEQQHEEILAQRDSLEASYNSIHIMSEIGQKMTALMDPATLINKVYQNVNVLMDAAGFGIGLLNEEANRLEFSNFIEKGEILPTVYDDLSNEHSLSAWCVRHREVIVINDLQKEYDQYLSERPQSDAGEIPESLIYLPLQIEQKITGVITVQSFSKNAYTEYHVNLLKNLATYVAIALNNANTYHELKDANAEIQEQRNQIVDSIRYAETIQKALLPQRAEIQNSFPESFVLFMPRDIVSGDFYWYRSVGQSVYLAVVDCTGHGVPGAFMSMIGHELLNEILSRDELLSPAQVLDLMNQKMVSVLNQDSEQNTDGMDVCLCRFDLPLKKVEFAGAKRPLFRVSGGEIEEIKGDKKSVGGRQSRKDAPFTDHELVLKPGEVLYLTTDGFIDQANEQLERFGTGRLKKELLHIHEMETGQQAVYLQQVLRGFQGKARQRDDVTVIGLKMS